jgi:hypothetical protein
MKFGMFAMADFLETVVIAGMTTALFLGGWQVPYLQASGFVFPGARRCAAAPGGGGVAGGRLPHQGRGDHLVPDADPVDTAPLPLRPGDAARLARPLPAARSSTSSSPASCCWPSEADDAMPATYAPAVRRWTRATRPAVLRQRFYVVEVLVGLKLTAQHFFGQHVAHTLRSLGVKGAPGSVTIQYPDERRPTRRGCASAPAGPPR